MVHRFERVDHGTDERFAVSIANGTGDDGIGRQLNVEILDLVARGERDRAAVALCAARAVPGVEIAIALRFQPVQDRVEINASGSPVTESTTLPESVHFSGGLS